MTNPNFKAGTIWTGDNLDIMRGMNDEVVDLLYLDPPFNSGEEWKAPVGSKAAGAAFKDAWTLNDVDEEALAIMSESPLKAHRVLVSLAETARMAHGPSMKSYLLYMGERLIEMERILAPTGSIYLHVDPTASHYLKPVLDGIFGRANFCNEIVWCYGGRGMSRSRFQRKHDTIFFYGKSGDRFFNVEGASRPVAEEHVGRYNKVDDQGRRYARVKNRDGSYSNIYLKDVVREDWWEIPYARGREHTGYPTQKPLALLERIIAASSNPGDLVFDPFCGCATTLVAAARLGRNWIGCDLSEKAVVLLEERLANVDLLSPCEVNPLSVSPTRTDLEKVSKKDLLWEALKAQGGKCVGCGVDFPPKIMELDRIIPGKRGGQYARGNVQALCSHCNRSKGGLTMPEWRAKKRAKE